VIVGNLTQAQAQSMADAILAPLASITDRASPAMPSVLPAVRVPNESSRINIAHSATQSHIWMGIPILARHEQSEFFALMVANHILGGGGFTSRLTQEVREKRGLSYSVFSAMSPLAQPGPFFVGLQTQRERAEEALGVVRDTLEAFVRDGPTEEELEAAKKNLLGGFALRLDSNRKLLDTLAQIGYYRLPINYLDRWTDAVSLVTKEEIRTLLRQRLDLNRLATVVVAGGSPPEAAGQVGR
jgi:zinc protease